MALGEITPGRRESLPRRHPGPELLIAEAEKRAGRGEYPQGYAREVVVGVDYRRFESAVEVQINRSGSMRGLGEHLPAISDQVAIRMRRG